LFLWVAVKLSVMLSLDLDPFGHRQSSEFSQRKRGLEILSESCSSFTSISRMPRSVNGDECPFWHRVAKRSCKANLSAQRAKICAVIPRPVVGEVHYNAE